MRSSCGLHREEYIHLVRVTTRLACLMHVFSHYTSEKMLWSCTRFDQEADAHEAAMNLRLAWAELQRSCSQLGSQRRGEQCQSLCHCRYYPPLPPPPPPPPPPRLLITTVSEPPVPLLRPWWMDFILIVTVGCTSAFFLLLILLLCYKSIKRYLLHWFFFM
ncbi:proline-rich membrane anchor 1 [Silurus asotus]|uniref:Proline-rich membrane anchor 1 n=1 Tax=Silurus asotus TaxID=30991 RepID=A0AAD5ANV4_SILAS|nr:proline-rich membrane anchor 1 [Silurus asotus]